MDKKDVKKVLVVEDDDNIRIAIEELLISEGYIVFTAQNGSKAIKSLDEGSQPNLILLDLFMPVMDGVEFLNQLRKSSDVSRSKIPVVVMSAAGDRVEKLASQTSAYIKKPIDIEKLLSTIQALA